jgi:hypothetical protein
VGLDFTWSALVIARADRHPLRDASPAAGPEISSYSDAEIAAGKRSRFASSTRLRLRAATKCWRTTWAVEACANGASYDRPSRRPKDQVARLI